MLDESGIFAKVDELIYLDNAEDLNMYDIHMIYIVSYSRIIKSLSVRSAGIDSRNFFFRDPGWLCCALQKRRRVGNRKERCAQ